MSNELGVRALVFDVFGTVVDWRSSVTREGYELAERLGSRLTREIDWAAFADAWRAKYQPSMERVRSGQRDWMRLDDLHLESLRELVVEFELPALSDAELAHLNRAWHRLDPWPDTVAGLTRLKSQFIIGTLSNGNIALLTNMAKFGGLPWDVILGAEAAQAYKPLAQAYERTCYLLDLAPSEVMLVAAHNDDLAAARACGMRTGFVPRPTEYGPNQSKDCQPESDWDIVATDFLDLAAKLGVGPQ